MPDNFPCPFFFSSFLSFLETGFNYLAKAGLKLKIILLMPLDYSDYRYALVLLVLTQV